jgi:hypothetical protein
LAKDGDSVLAPLGFLFSDGATNWRRLKTLPQFFAALARRPGRLLRSAPCRFPGTEAEALDARQH